MLIISDLLHNAILSCNFRWFHRMFTKTNIIYVPLILTMPRYKLIKKILLFSEFRNSVDRYFFHN